MVLRARSSSGLFLSQKINFYVSCPAGYLRAAITDRADNIDRSVRQVCQTGCHTASGLESLTRRPGFGLDIEISILARNGIHAIHGTVIAFIVVYEDLLLRPEQGFGLT